MKNTRLTRRTLLTGAAAAATLRAAPGVALRQKRILTLVRDAASNSMRAVEKIVWVAR